jgi:hypothetical protein
VNAPTRLALALAVALAPTAPGHAQEREHFRYELSAGLQYSDNRLRTVRDPLDDLLFVPRAEFSVLHLGDRVQARGQGQVEAERSLDAGESDELRGRLAATVDVAVVPRRLYWTFQDHADVESIDPLLADAPDNRQQTNIALTGPALLLGDPRGWNARFDALAGRGTAEATPRFDHDRASFGATVQRRTDAVRAWGLSTESSRVDFDLADEPGFTRHDALLRFENETPRVGLDLAFGHTWIAHERSGGDASRPAFRGLGRWTPRASDTFRLAYARELSDAGRDLGRALLAGDALHDASRRWRVDSNVYELHDALLSWERRGVRSEFTVAAFDRDYGYLERGLLLDRASRGARFDGRLRLNTRWVASAFAGTERFRYEQQARSDRDSQLSLQAERRVGTRWALRGGWSHYRRDSDAPDASFRENVVSVFLVFMGGAR